MTKNLKLKNETWLVLRGKRDKLVQEKKEHVSFDDTIMILAGARE